MFWKQISVEDQERALIVNNGRKPSILTPGEYCIPMKKLATVAIEKHNVGNVVFRSVWADYLVRRHPDLTECYFHRVETNATQVGLVYVDGGLFTVLTPSKRMLFWRGTAAVTAEFVGLIGA